MRFLSDPFIFQGEALAMREIARGLRDVFTINGPGRVARVLLALRDA